MSRRRDRREGVNTDALYFTLFGFRGRVHRLAFALVRRRGTLGRLAALAFLSTAASLLRAFAASFSFAAHSWHHLGASRHVGQGQKKKPQPRHSSRVSRDHLSPQWWHGGRFFLSLSLSLSRAHSTLTHSMQHVARSTSMPSRALSHQVHGALLNRPVFIPTRQVYCPPAAVPYTPGPSCPIG